MLRNHKQLLNTDRCQRNKSIFVSAFVNVLGISVLMGLLNGSEVN